MKNAFLVALLMISTTAHADVFEQAALAERGGAAYLAEQCRDGIAATLKSGSYYKDKDVDGILARFSNERLAGELLKSEKRHSTSDSRSEGMQQERLRKFTEIFKDSDKTTRCKYLGAMFDSYRAIGEAQQNLADDESKLAQQNFLAAHAADIVTLDYSMRSKSIGELATQTRPAKGTVRSLTLEKYLNWERTSAANWKSEIWNASGMRNKNAVYNRCLTEVTDEWTKSFGYRETTLRSSVFVDGQVNLSKALRIICSPG
ncbi:hypothetical protein [Duganella radicis]|uniref:DUF2599 domain-containing protein n=1 Tax=Duganella radicis TaxID=551988 RepID=A0A6L6PGA4_9BURK|nr:hypothetical protein [Duganella radicis]MTV38044.1 hypothetical protein [Duganella radicis]